MFEHLICPANKITLKQPIKNRDGDEVDYFTLGYGYGILHGMGNEEIKAHGVGKYSNLGTILHYVPDTTVESVTVDGILIEKDRTAPQIGDYAITASGTQYYLSGVEIKVDIYNKFIGYKVLCSNV